MPKRRAGKNRQTHPKRRGDMNRERRWQRRQDEKRREEQERAMLLKRVLPRARRAMALSKNGRARAILGGEAEGATSLNEEDWNNPDVWVLSNLPRMPDAPGILCDRLGIYRGRSLSIFDAPWDRLPPGQLRLLLKARWVPDDPKDVVTALGELSP